MNESNFPQSAVGASFPHRRSSDHLDELNFFGRAGDVISRLRSYDWSATPLGPVNGWPRSLCATMRLVLDNPQPACVWWGPHLISIYNDAYAAILGTRHPAALCGSASRVWRESWEALESPVRSLLNGGSAWSEERCLLVEDGRCVEEKHFAFSYSSLRDEKNAIAGVLTLVTDHTARVLNERRLQMVSDLANGIAKEARSVERACHVSVRTLTRHSSDVSFALIYMIESDDYLLAADAKRARRVAMAGLPEMSSAAPASVSLMALNGDARGWPFGVLLSARCTEVVTNLDARFDDSSFDARRPVSVAAVVPILKAGHEEVAGFLIVGIHPYRRFDSPYRDFLEIIAAQIAVAVANEAAGERIETLKELSRVRQEAERRIRAIFDSLTDGFQVIDEQWRLSQMNTAARAILKARGIDSESMIGQSWADRPFPIDQSGAVERHFTRAMTERTPIVFEHYHDVWQRWYESRAYPMPGGGLAHVFRDITEHKRAEEALRESEARFRAIADSSPMMIWVDDPAGRIQFGNRACLEFFRLTEEQISGLDWRAAVHPDDRTFCVEAFRLAVERGEPLHVCARMQRADGQWRWIESRGNPIMDQAGGVVRFVGCSADITDIVESQRASQESDRRKDEFLATLAHELRNPLAAVNNALNVLKLTGREGANPAADRSYQMMERKVAQMVRLVDDLLEVSRVNTGKIDLRKEVMDLAMVIGDAVESSMPMISSAGHELKVNLPAERILLHADPLRLTQVFANLLNNAVKYTKGKGCIWVSVRQDGSHVVVSVRDNGVGIPAAMLSKVFDMFTQVDRSSHRADRGLGIGLTLVRNLVSLHGGSVEALSEGIGHGTEITVRLPLLEGVRA